MTHNAGVKRPGGFFFAFFQGVEMETLIPETFLHVSDKFFADFVYVDRDLKLGPSHLYLFLFRQSLRDGMCSIPQQKLACVCKGSERAVRNYVSALVRLEYLEVLRNAEDGCNTYRLLKSPRLLRMLERLGYDTSSLFLPRQRQNVPGAAAKSATPPYRNKRVTKSITPLTPHPAHGKQSAPAPTASASPLPGTTGGACATPPETRCAGRGYFSSVSEEGGTRRHAAPGKPAAGKAGAAKGMTASALPALFDRLWDRWPVKKDRVMAQKTFFGLARAGRLPGIDTLLDVVDRFSRGDAHWMRGYVPVLTSWLRGERWNDEPLIRQENGMASDAATPSGTRAMPDARELPPVRRSPEDEAAASETSALFAAVGALWPSEPTVKVRSSLARARLHGFSTAELLERARFPGARPPAFDAWLEGLYAC